MYCLQCRIPRLQDVCCRACGFVYVSPPRPVAEASPEEQSPGGGVREVLDEHWPTDLFEMVLLLFITGTNPTGVAVIAFSLMVAILVGASLSLGFVLSLLVFGAIAFGFDLLARRMLRCSLTDKRRGSQVCHIPVWQIGLFFAAVAALFRLFD